MAKPGGPVEVARAATAEEKKLEREKATAARLDAVVEAARALVHGWDASGFYDRQEPTPALALHEALTAYDAG